MCTQAHGHRSAPETVADRTPGQTDRSRPRCDPPGPYRIARRVCFLVTVAGHLEGTSLPAVAMPIVVHTTGPPANSASGSTVIGAQRKPCRPMALGLAKLCLTEASRGGLRSMAVRAPGVCCGIEFAHATCRRARASRCLLPQGISLSMAPRLSVAGTFSPLFTFWYSSRN